MSPGNRAGGFPLQKIDGCHGDCVHLQHFVDLHRRMSRQFYQDQGCYRAAAYCAPERAPLFRLTRRPGLRHDRKSKPIGKQERGKYTHETSSCSSGFSPTIADPDG
jgi:hypothetical protein